MANDAFRFLDEKVSRLGPFYYRSLSEELEGGLHLFRFPDYHEPADLCVIWFEDHPALICTRACFVDTGEKPNEFDVRASLKAKAQYWLSKKPEGDDVN